MELEFTGSRKRHIKLKRIIVTDADSFKPVYKIEYSDERNPEFYEDKQELAEGISRATDFLIPNT